MQQFGRGELRFSTNNKLSSGFVRPEDHIVQTCGSLDQVTETRVFRAYVQPVSNHPSSKVAVNYQHLKAGKHGEAQAQVYRRDRLAFLWRGAGDHHSAKWLG